MASAPRLWPKLEKIIDHFNSEGVARFEIEKGLVGGGAYDTHGKAISDADMELAASGRRDLPGGRRRSEVGRRSL